MPKMKLNKFLYINGELRDPGYEFEYPYQAGVGLVASGAARWVSNSSKPAQKPDPVEELVEETEPDEGEQGLLDEEAELTDEEKEKVARARDALESDNWGQLRSALSLVAPEGMDTRGMNKTEVIEFLEDYLRSMGE